MKFTLNIWRQKGSDERGRFVTYEAHDVSSGMSFLEMLDGVNQRLIVKGEEPVAFEQDCREGICGSCSLVINGIPHGPDRGITTCQYFLNEIGACLASASSAPSARTPTYDY